MTTTVFKIPRVCVHIPGETSRTKFVPEYEYPLFQRIYRGRIADPAGDPLRIIPHPKDSTYESYWYEIEAESLNELVDVEAGRLRNQFGPVIDKKGEATDDTVFDVVYIGNLFQEAVEKALEKTDKLATDEVRADPADKILALCEPLRIDRRTARRLTAIGWTDVEALSQADEAQLGKILGRVNAHKLIEAANKELNILLNATPAEQIAAAKGSKK